MDWAVIERARMFEQFPKQRVPALFAQLQPQRKAFAKGEVLVRDGQRVNAFAIVESGEFIATKLYRDGRQSLLTKYIPGFLIGIDIAATKKKVSTYYITATRDSVVHTIPYETVSKPGKLPEADRLIMMESILGLIAGENLRKMSQIEIISQKGLRSRILTFLAIQRSFFLHRIALIIPYFFLFCHLFPVCPVKRAKAFSFSPESPVRHPPESGRYNPLLCESHIPSALLLKAPDSGKDQSPLQPAPFPHVLPLYVRSLYRHRRHSASCVPDNRSAMLQHESVPSASAS